MTVPRGDAAAEDDAAHQKARTLLRRSRKLHRRYRKIRPAQVLCATVAVLAWASAALFSSLLWSTSSETSLKDLHGVSSGSEFWTSSSSLRGVPRPPPRALLGDGRRIGASPPLPASSSSRREAPTMEERIRTSSVTWHQWCNDTMKREGSIPVHLVDKHAVKAFVHKMRPSLKIAREYAYVDDADAITAEMLGDLPENYMMKATHMSGGIIKVNDGKTKCLKDPCRKRWKNETEVSSYLRRMCGRFLATDYGVDTDEPHYLSIPRRCIFEEQFDLDPETFRDFKVLVVNHRPMLVIVQAGRYNGIKINFRTPGGWNEVPIRDVYSKNTSKVLPKADDLGNRPTFLDNMLEDATQLSVASEVPSLRVDFFVLGTDTYAFAETTFTHRNCNKGERGWDPPIADLFYGFAVTHPEETIRPELLLEMLHAKSLKYSKS